MAWCVVPALVVPSWKHTPQGECGEEEQDVLGCGGVLEIWCVVLALVVLDRPGCEDALEVSS